MDLGFVLAGSYLTDQAHSMAVVFQLVIFNQRMNLIIKPISEIVEIVMSHEFFTGGPLERI